MITKRKDINIDHSITDGIYQPMFVSNATAPDPLQITFQRLWFTNTRKWVLKNVFKQLRYAFHNSLIACRLPICQILFGFRHQLYFHKSSSLMTRPRPSSISFWPWRKISTIAGEDMIYSVSSIACFCAVNFLRYLTAFFISPSSSAMMLSSRNNSAFSCNVVITSIL